jgi:hypothetical protein
MPIGWDLIVAAPVAAVVLVLVVVRAAVKTMTAFVLEVPSVFGDFGNGICAKVSC